MAPQRGTGFTDIGQYLAANQGTLADESAQLGGTIGGELDKAKTDADAAYANVQPGTLTDYSTVPGYGDALTEQTQAQQDATNLGTAGGLQDLLQRTRGDSADQGAFDAQLLTGNPQLTGAQQKATTLGDYLDAAGQSASRPAPVIVNDPGSTGGGVTPPGYGHPGDPPDRGDPNTPPGESGTPATPGDPKNPRKGQGGY